MRGEVERRKDEQQRPRGMRRKRERGRVGRGRLEGKIGDSTREEYSQHVVSSTPFPPLSLALPLYTDFLLSFPLLQFNLPLRSKLTFYLDYPLFVNTNCSIQTSKMYLTFSFSTEHSSHAIFLPYIFIALLLSLYSLARLLLRVFTGSTPLSPSSPSLSFNAATRIGTKANTKKTKSTRLDLSPRCRDRLPPFKILLKCPQSLRRTLRRFFFFNIILSHIYAATTQTYAKQTFTRRYSMNHPINWSI